MHYDLRPFGCYRPEADIQHVSIFTANYVSPFTRINQSKISAMKYVFLFLVTLFASTSALSIGDSAGGCRERKDLLIEIQTTNGDIPLLLLDIERRLNLERSTLSSWMKAKLAEKPSLAVSWEKETRPRLLSEPLPCSNDTPLDIALRYSNLAAVKAILDAGADPEGAFFRFLHGESRYTVFGERCSKYGAPPMTSLSPSQKEVWQFLADASEAAGRHFFGSDVKNCRDRLLRDFLVSIGAGRKRMNPPSKSQSDASAFSNFSEWADAWYGPGTESAGGLRRATFKDVANWSATIEKQPFFSRRLPDHFPNLENAWTSDNDTPVILATNVAPNGVIFFTPLEQQVHLDRMRKRRPDATYFFLRYQEWRPIGGGCVGPSCRSSIF